MKAKREGASESASTVRSVTRAMTLLSSLTVDGLSLTEAAHRVEIPLPTALRLMRTLESTGFAQRQDNGTFVVGPAAIMLAYQTDPSGPLRWMIRQAVNELRDVSEETAAFFLTRGVETQCVEVAESRKPIRWVCPQGARTAMHLTLPGRLMLALGPTEEILAEIPTNNGTFVSRDGSIRTLDELRAELDTVRAQRVSTSDFSSKTDSWGFALPFPYEGPTIGAFTIAGPRNRTGSRRDELIALCREVVQRVGTTMSFDDHDNSLGSRLSSLDHVP